MNLRGIPNKMKARKVIKNKFLGQLIDMVSRFEWAELKETDKTIKKQWNCPVIIDMVSNGKEQSLIFDVI